MQTAITLLILTCHLQSIIGQFSSTDGTNDLFALFTQCPISPRYPPDNQFFCYRTNQIVVSGFTLCDPVFVRQRNISVADRTDTHTVFYINTPGRMRGANYVNRLMCRWNIECPRGQLMYFDFPEHDIEEAVSSPFFIDPICIDYLKVSRDFADFITCGTNAPEKDLEPSKLLVEFRSNRRRRSPGFRMRAICFDPSTQDGVGCTTESTNIKREAKESRTASYDFEKLLTRNDHDILNKLIREKRVPLSNGFVLKDIVTDAKVIFHQNTITVLLKGELIYSFPGINYFHTFNEFAGLRSYYSQRFENNTITLRGFGVLIIVDDAAYYILFGVDSRFLPNAKEQRMIRSLLNAGEVLVVNDDFVMQEDMYSHNNNHRNGHSGKRSINDQPTHSQGKRMATGATTGLFPPEIVNLAQSAQNSCNAVLMAAAQTILNNV